MNGDSPDSKDLPEDDMAEDEASVDVSETDIITSLDDDNIGDLSVEVNVEELVADLEPVDDSLVHRKSEIRRKLEELRELKEKELESTYNISLDEE